ncbi:MAG TPA: hypothetical protein VK671_13030 [Mucilaginibacter sp.]|jgi:hypothetical protein|nr:hypothetical protein [Mucilaginibacter sp.]
MRTLLVINDNSSEAIHAAEFALLIAQKIQTRILLFNTFEITGKPGEKAPTIVAKICMGDCVASERLHYLKSPEKELPDFTPRIEEFDISNMNESEVIGFVNRNPVWMIIKGMGEVIPTANARRSLNIHTVLNRVLCPLLLIPAKWQLKKIERLAYIADLRYCRIQIVRYLAELAGLWHAALSIVHRSASGLPDITENYADILFREEVSNKVNYDQLFFYKVKEKAPAKAVDAMINETPNDILVLVNHRFHFEEIVGRYITEALPPHITIPLFIFPY